MSFVYWKSGYNLTREELNDIKNNFVISEHAAIRMKQRGFNPEDIIKVLDNPCVAFWNIDRSVDIANDEYHYLVFRYKKRKEKNYYVLITYTFSSKSGLSKIYKKQMLAKLKIKSPGLNRV